MNYIRYNNNQEPQIGDRVKFASNPTGETYVVTSVKGGRVENLVGVVPEFNQKTLCQKYYYYRFIKA